LAAPRSHLAIPSAPAHHCLVEYLDLTAYEFLRSVLPMTAAGWLGPEHGVQGGTEHPLTAGELRALRAASARVAMKTLGRHECEFCAAADGNGEFHYYLPDGAVFAAPTMILHYAEQHRYRPPAPVLLAGPAPLRWDERADRLCSVLLDENADPTDRTEAAIGLARWDDRRAHDALWDAMRDEELLDCAGDEVGRSLAAFAGRAYARDPASETLHPMVRHGIGNAGQDDRRIFLHTRRP
jgi:hypothetical protein